MAHQHQPRNRSIFAESKQKELENPTPSGIAEISIKDFFDFMKTAYEVYEHLETNEKSLAEGRIDWDELTKITLINHILDQKDRDLLSATPFAEKRMIISKSESEVGRSDSKDVRLNKRVSLNDIEGITTIRVPMPLPLDVTANPECWTESNLKAAVQDVINEGILDSILPYMIGYKRPTRTTSAHQPIIKSATSLTKDVKKFSSFSGFHSETPPNKDRLGRRESSLVTEKNGNPKNDIEVEIHVCDEIKGQKKDFKCPQKLLVSKMGYFADVTSGQRLQDMDISVHCDIQIFDWLMRWVKKESILVADWPMLDPANVIPILISATFLQMEPLLDDCLAYCHTHMSEIIKTSTNLACLSDALITRLAAMYTNSEIEEIKDRKDKIQSRLYCKLILSLAEPVPETLRGHFASIATLFKCNKCNKLMVDEIAEKIPCQPVNVRVDRRGNVVSNHSRDPSWSLNEYILWLHGELKKWRRVYWRLWGDCHFLRCRVCESHFPVYQMEWCCHHPEVPQYFSLDSYRASLPIGRYPCCGERAYRFQILQKPLQGCQFRSHLPYGESDREVTVMDVYIKFREVIAMPPPHLMFPERLAKLISRDTQAADDLRLQGTEKFWWDGIEIVPQREPFGLLGKLYTSDNTFDPNIKQEPSTEEADPVQGKMKIATEHVVLRIQQKVCIVRKGPAADASPSDAEDSDSSSSSSEASAASEESVAPTKAKAATRRRRRLNRVNTNRKISNKQGRQWAMGMSARGNQDAQRRYEERTIPIMRAQLTQKKVAPKIPAGGVYVKLESDWRELNFPNQAANRQRSLTNTNKAQSRSVPKFCK